VAYQLSGYEVIARLLAGPGSDTLKERVLKAIERIAEEPDHEDMMPVPEARLPTFVCTVAAGDEMAAMTYCVLGLPLHSVRFLRAEWLSLLT